MAASEPERPACVRCRHYFVTWDPERPRGCRAFGFKTSTAPSDVVRRDSGVDCQLYEAKPAVRNRGRAR